MGTTTTKGVMLIAKGRSAQKEARDCIKSLKEFHSWPIKVIDNNSPKPGKIARWEKVNLLSLSPFDYTLYLDADTRIHGDLSVGFRALDAGWELIMVPSAWLSEPLYHLIKEERDFTLSYLGDNLPIMLNTGVMWFRKTDRTRKFWKIWHEEWERFKEHDQGAFLRALNRNPVELLILGSPYNTTKVQEAIIEHRFGAASE